MKSLQVNILVSTCFRVLKYVGHFSQIKMYAIETSSNIFRDLDYKNLNTPICSLQEDILLRFSITLRPINEIYKISCEFRWR